MVVIKNLTKEFSGGITAVSDVSLHISKGETVGLIGANGAGKTTLIKMICGLYLPTSGYIRVFGENPFGRKSKNMHIGIVTGQVVTDGYNRNLGHGSSLFQDELSLELNMELIKNIYKIPNDIFKKRLRNILSEFDLQGLMHYRINQLSLGQRMKAEVAAVLLFQPSLLILDEPFIGVDVVAKENLRKVLHDLSKDKEITIILTTHNVEEIEKICQRVVFINKGRLVYDGSFDRLKKSHIGLNSMRVKFDGMPPDLQDFPIHRYKMENNTITLYYDSGVVRSKDISNYLLSHGSVQDILITKPSVEEIIKELYKEDNNGTDNN